MRLRVLTPAERRFFAELFTAFDQADIKWMLLRNYEEFPDQIGNDLDVFVPFAQFQQAWCIFEKTLHSSNGKFIHFHKRSYFEAIRFRINEGAILHIDLYPGAFTWHGYFYLQTQAVVESRVRSRGYFIPKPAHEALSLLVTSPLWGGFIKTRYLDRVRMLLQSPEERIAFEQISREVFAWVPPFETAKAEDGRQWAQRLRNGLRKHAFRNHPIQTLYEIIRHWLYEIWVHYKPPGILIEIKHLQPEEWTSHIEAAAGLDFGKPVIFRSVPLTKPWQALKEWIHIWRALAKGLLIIRCIKASTSPAKIRIAAGPGKKNQICIPCTATADTLPHGDRASILKAIKTVLESKISHW